MASDAELKSQYYSVKADRDRYRRVRDGISSHRLDYKRSTSDMEDYISYIESIVNTIDGESGYFYLESASSKLKEHKQVLQDYVDFVQNSNSSFISLYNDVVAKISSLESQLESIKTEYNKGKKHFNRLGLDENPLDFFGGGIF
ncbi:hypothetical protein [Streptococcus sanguinis]|jgi:hypothetical protein|uniref:Uncharacterized protein n=5 Tax=Streptococcus sanguinis TaxID=1305 RepID=A3CNE0_STRSV|nr:hypothetical protein [Streptococcus sanguinis]RKV97302.1 MAG: hypothetical protein D8H99_22740 [Streptococcus sp.]ABN44695.1 Hypothetical protein SSA_1296 [Streptococcus sanguinis SK36]EFX94394.1 hypothetical protein HMPREF9398_1163 [Streptococcus sanguinis VMC66]EGC22976.1 hypothetical protein HMPREF9388_0588 [Streptococcus sanguinis SK353]EGD29597.1 hypothetical protein HMPREF9381_1110 [Streptococcus sanguinis SK72]